MTNKNDNHVDDPNELPDKKGVYVRDEASEASTQKRLPKLDFTTYVMSLGHTVQVALGKLPNPETNESFVDLDVARQFIDILILLHEKTEGNLTTEEKKLFDALLYELRVQYVSVVSRSN